MKPLSIILIMLWRMELQPNDLPFGEDSGRNGKLQNQVNHGQHFTHRSNARAVISHAPISNTGGSSYLASVLSLSKPALLIILVFILIGCSGYNIRVMGIDVKDFKGRDWKKVAIGVPVSFIVHEAGHLLFAASNGGGHIDFSSCSVIMENYHNQSHGTQQNFHRAGFLSQLAVGGLLTLLPSTRHSDITFGFNATTTLGTALYGMTGGLNSNDESDVRQLDNGSVESGVYTGIAGGLTYINLNKSK